MVAEGQHLKMTVSTINGFNSDVALNVFSYDILSISPSLTLAGSGDEIAEAWLASFGPIWANIISSSYLMSHMKIEIYENPLDFWEGDFATAQAGTQSGSIMPAFTAWGFKLSRSSRLSRNGSKRFAGVTESNVDNGNPIAGILTYLDGVADWMGQTHVFDFGPGDVLNIELAPVIPHYVPLSDTWVFNPITSVAFTRVTSQNTRKVGRGS